MRLPTFYKQNLIPNWGNKWQRHQFLKFCHNRLLFYYQSAKQATIYAIAKDCASECRTLSSLECYAERSQAYQTLVCSSLVLVCSWGYFSTNTMKAANSIFMPLAASNLWVKQYVFCIPFILDCHIPHSQKEYHHKENLFLNQENQSKLQLVQSHTPSFRV